MAESGTSVVVATSKVFATFGVLGSTVASISIAGSGVPAHAARASAISMYPTEGSGLCLITFRITVPLGAGQRDLRDANVASLTFSLSSYSLARWRLLVAITGERIGQTKSSVRWVRAALLYFADLSFGYFV